MEVLVVVVHAVAAILLGSVILLQSGKGGGMGAGFGGTSAAATQIFGGRGATGFLGNTTVGLAAVFMITSLTLAYLSAAPQTKMDLNETDGVAPAQEDEVVESGAGAAAQPAVDVKPEEVKPTEAPSDVPAEGVVPAEPAENAPTQGAAPAEDAPSEVPAEGAAE